MGSLKVVEVIVEVQDKIRVAYWVYGHGEEASLSVWSILIHTLLDFRDENTDRL